MVSFFDPEHINQALPLKKEGLASIADEPHRDDPVSGHSYAVPASLPATAANWHLPKPIPATVPLKEAKALSVSMSLLLSTILIYPVSIDGRFLHLPNAPCCFVWMCFSDRTRVPRSDVLSYQSFGHRLVLTTHLLCNLYLTIVCVRVRTSDPECTPITPYPHRVEDD